MSRHFARHLAPVTGIDIDEGAVAFATAGHDAADVEFRTMDALHTHWTLKRMCGEFEVTDYTGRVVREPERFAAVDSTSPGGLQQKLALALLRAAYWFSPGYIWLLRKPSADSRS